MATTREVITIQCGHYSNFIGAHWWNLQESALWSPLLKKEDKNEINYDCTFREGITLTGKETYTPRLIAIDCPGSLSSLKETGSLYEVGGVENTPPVAWEGHVDVYSSEKNIKNEFLSDIDKMSQGEIEEEVIESKSYQLESIVEVWSDYLRPHLHPNTLLTVPDYHHNDDRFNIWTAGQEVWQNKKFLRAFEDSLHFFTEECDYLQGYQLLVDTHIGGFESLGTCISQYLADEMGSSKEIITVLTTPTVGLSQDNLTSQDVMHYILNSALGVSEFWDSCSLLLPLSLYKELWRLPSDLLCHSSFNYDVSLSYHTSAVLAAALETCTSVYRSPSSNEVMSNITRLLNVQGKKICSLMHSLPYQPPLFDETTKSSHLFSSLYPLTPCSTHTPTDDLWAQSISIRGYSNFHDNKPHPSTMSSSTSLAHQIYATHPSTNNGISLFDSPLTLGTPYPVNILSPPLSSPLSSPPLSSSLVSSSVDVNVSSCTSLQNHSGIQKYFSSLCDHAQRINPRLAPSYYSTCLDNDTFQELVVKITDLRDGYKTRYDGYYNDSTDEEN